MAQIGDRCAIHVEVGSLSHAPGRPVTGPIWIECDGKAFPAQGWHDFPVPILTAALEQFSGVVHRDAGDALVLFMEGPYEVGLTRIDSLWVLSLRERRRHGATESRASLTARDVQALSDSARRAGATVLDWLDRRGIVGSDTMALRSALK